MLRRAGVGDVLEWADWAFLAVILALISVLVELGAVSLFTSSVLLS